MKNDQKQFLYNLIECARETYVKTFNLAITGDFCKDKLKLDKLDSRVFKSYYTNQKKPKKVFKDLIYASGMIYNNEVIVDSNICQTLTFLILVVQYKLYTPHKFILFKNKQLYRICAGSGISYNKTTSMINKLLQGVNENANNS